MRVSIKDVESPQNRCSDCYFYVSCRIDGDEPYDSVQDCIDDIGIGKHYGSPIIGSEDNERIFIFPKGNKIEIPEKYNEEWLKTSSMKDKINFLDEFLNGFNDAYEQPKLYVKDCNDIDSIIVRQQTKINELNEEKFK